MSKEIWKPINNYEGLYEISNYGRVKSLDKIIKSKNRFGSINKKIKKKILSPHKNEKTGYMQVILTKNNNHKIYLVHRLVAQVFIDNSKNSPEINHINGIKTDNRVENLEWCTRSENLKHSFKLGLSHTNLKKIKGGIEHPFYGKHHSKETREQISKNHCKKVNQYDKNNNFIRMWNSTLEIEEKLNINNGNISSCCNNRRKSAGGYIWRYANEG